MNINFFSPLFEAVKTITQLLAQIKKRTLQKICYNNEHIYLAIIISSSDATSSGFFLTQIMLTSVCIAAGYDNMSLTDLGVASSLKCLVLYLGGGTKEIQQQTPKILF